MARRAVVILFYNRFFDAWPKVPDSCLAPCRFTTDPDAFEDADAVVFHVPTCPPLDGLRKRPRQLWVAWSMESRVMWPSLADPAFMALFDLTMTYERASDVWYPYFGRGTVDALRKAPGAAPPVASAERPVVFLQANPHDRCGRLAYAAELMRRVPVDSFGPVLRNRREVIPPGYAARVDLYGRYKFTLAFENSFAPDYVTEKLYEPLVAGSVPVYRGTADVADLAPAPDGYVDAADFGSATELGAYLDHLDGHDDEYLRYHAWRERGPSPAFLRLVDQIRLHPLCRLADLVSARAERVDERS